VKYYQFLVLYSIVGGFGVGLSYMAPIVAAWLHFPNRKGLVSGIAISGVSAGAFVYSYIAMNVVNPSNKLHYYDDASLEELNMAEKAIYWIF